MVPASGDEERKEARLQSQNSNSGGDSDIADSMKDPGIWDGAGIGAGMSVCWGSQVEVEDGGLGLEV